MIRDVAETGVEAGADLSNAPNWTTRMVDLLFYVGLAGLLAIYLVPLLDQQPFSPITVAAGFVAVASLFSVHLRRTQPMLLFVLLLVASTLLSIGDGVPAGLFLLPPALFCLEAYDQRRWVRRWVVPTAVAALLLWLLVAYEQIVVRRHRFGNSAERHRLGPGHQGTAPIPRGTCGTTGSCRT